MQSFSTQEKISRLISKIQIDWKRAGGGNHEVSRIDKDILTDDIKKLYELVYELETSATKQNTPYLENSPEKVVVEDIPNAPQTDIQLESEPEVAGKEDDVPEKEQMEEQAEELSKEPVFVTEETEEVIEVQAEEEEAIFSQPPVEHEINGDEVDGPEPKQKEVEQLVEQPPKKPANHAKATLDLFSASKTLADVYQNDKDNSLAAKIQNNKILDIKTAIGINDKFLFINEIFKGEMSVYNQAIEKLNQTTDFSDAIHLIEELKSNYGNEENLTSFNKLFEIAKRRFH